MKYLLSTLLLLSACKQEISTPKTLTANNPQPQEMVANKSIVPPAVVGHQLVITVPTGSSPSTAQALLFLPHTYDSNTNVRFPIIIELPGIGQQSNNINDMINTGLCQLIAQGFCPHAINPVDGRNYKFIVFSPQGPPGSWGWQQSQVMGYMLPDLLKTYRIDTSRIYVTGFSAGGWGAVTFMDDNIATVKKIAAICPIAPASLDNEPDIKWAAQYGLATWTVVGSEDAFLPNAETITNDINNNKPIIPAKLTVIPGVGHSSWNQAYDPTWYDPADPKKLNLYEWFLQYKRNETTKPL